MSHTKLWAGHVFTAEVSSQVGERQDGRGGQPRHLTWAHVLLLLHVCHVEAPQVHGSHAESELADGPPLPEPVREPGQVAVTVQLVGVEAPGRGDRGDRLSPQEVGRLPLAERSAQTPCSFAQHDNPLDPRGELPSALQTDTGASTLLLLSHK